MLISLFRILSLFLIIVCLRNPAASVIYLKKIWLACTLTKSALKQRWSLFCLTRNNTNNWNKSSLTQCLQKQTNIFGIFNSGPHQRNLGPSWRQLVRRTVGQTSQVTSIVCWGELMISAFVYNKTKNLTALFHFNKWF